MAAYLLLFPGNRVRVLLFNIIPTTVSAFAVIGLWFVFQVINGLGYLGGTQTDGVAYTAHIGGFCFWYFLRFANLYPEDAESGIIVID